MTDDPIRTLLAGLTPVPFIWSRKGTVVFMDEQVRAAGGDSKAVAEWVEAHAGDVDRTVPQTGNRRAISMIPKAQSKTYYVVPESELAG